MTGRTHIIRYSLDLYGIIAYGVVFWVIAQISAPRSKIGDLEGLIERAPKQDNDPATEA